MMDASFSLPELKREARSLAIEQLKHELMAKHDFVNLEKLKKLEKRKIAT